MPTTRRKMLGLAATGVTVAVLGTLAFGGQANAHDASFRATLRDPSGAAVGTLKLRISSHATEVTVKLRPSTVRNATRRLPRLPHPCQQR